MTIADVLATLLRREALPSADADALFERILRGELNDAQIGAVLSLIQARGATVDELAGAAAAMRRHAMRLPVVDSAVRPIIDTCGTGGAPKTFNVSTAAAIVAAAAAPGRVRVAKHGNRSRTGRGSAEVLAALGVNVDATPEVQARCLDEVGVCFCFAIHHHPAVKHAMPARRALGFPTIFNLLGPLTNPAGASRQLIGVYDASLVEPMARALARLGAVRAWVVHGEDGLDEITTTAPTRIARVEGGTVEVDMIDPRPLGLARASLADLSVGSLDQAARVFRDLVGGHAGAARDMVVLNAAAALVVAGAARDLPGGLDMARAAIDSGEARRTLDRLVALTRV